MQTRMFVGVKFGPTFYSRFPPQWK